MTAQRDAARRDARREARAGFFWRHLVGEYSLGRSYWLHAVLLAWAPGAWRRSASGCSACSANRCTASTAVLCFEPLAVAVWLKEHWAVAQGKQPTEGFEVTLRDQGRVVSFSGGVLAR